jgi:4'-phosphopantetheinyl transferase
MAESLGRAEAHIWYVWPDRITDAKRLGEYEDLLCSEEQNRSASFRFPERRRIHVLTRAFVRTMLSRYADVAPRQWRFSKNDYGKPRISSPPEAPPIAFNVSHTPGLIACVIALESPVGIDAENLNRSMDFVELAGRYFSATEYRELRGRTETALRRRFFEYWTLKEAYVKARGMGITMDLSRFTFHLAPGGVIRMTFDASAEDNPDQWRFHQFSPGDDHIVACATRLDAGQSVRFEIRDGTALMQ